MIVYYDISSSYPESMMRNHPPLRALDNQPHVRIKRGRVRFIPATGMCPKQRDQWSLKVAAKVVFGVVMA